MKLGKILSLTILFIPLCLYAVRYPVVTYQSADGLPQNYINALIQDSMGYIFVGTQSGIGKFDGTRFVVLTQKNGLPSNYITDFALDKEKNIWVATLEGLARIEPLRNYNIQTFMDSRTILSLSVDPVSGILWIMSKKGVFYLHNEELTNYQLLNFKFRESEENHIKGLLVNGNEKYFYSTAEVLNAGDQIIRTFKSPEAINFLKKSGQNIVVGTENGLFLLDGETGEYRPYFQLPPGRRSVTDLTTDGYGNLWIGTRNGLLIYKSITESPIVITNENGLSSNRIQRLMVDREQNVFVGTRWGMSQLSPVLFRMYGESDGIPSKFVWSYHEDLDRGVILVGCDHGIVMLDTWTGKITPADAVNEKLKGQSVRTILAVGTDNYLLGTREHGIYRWDGADRLEMLNRKARVISGVKIAPGTFWFGTDDGLLKYDGNQFSRVRNGLRDKIVWTLAVIDSDTLLVGTGNGVQKYHKGEFVSSQFDQIDTNTVINGIHVVSPGEVLVASELNGLYIFNGDRMERRTTQNGLLHNDTWSAIKDDSQNIWLNTSVSVDRITDGFISHFNKKTGLFGDEGSIHAAFKSSNGTLYFGITPGLLEIPPQPGGGPAINNPILHIEQIKVNGKTLRESSGDEIYLSHNKNTLEFSYIAVSTRKENPIFYKTRLEPFDRTWSEPTRETRIKYLNLPPGEYTFDVMANNGGGEDKWFRSRNSFLFTLEKPVWLKWWFILLVIGAVVFLIVLFIRIRLNHLEKQKKYLEALVRERTEELKQLSITDPLTDLKNRRYLEEKIKEDISLIERFIYTSQKDPDKTTGNIVTVLGVFILDIDYFKRVNDEHGHKAGDIVIVDIAKMLIEMLRNSDTIVRWGGEEFLVITRQQDSASSLELAERIRQKVESFEFKIDEDMIIRKTVSVGFAHFPFIPGDIKHANWHHVVSLADSALYIAKNSGRNVSVGIEWDDRELDIDFKEIVSDIKMGIEKKYLKLTSIEDDLTVLQHKT